MNLELWDICANRHKGNANSAEANRRVKKEPQRLRVLNVIKSHPTGITCEEIEVYLPIPHQSCSARISELKARGLVKITGTRPTKTGCPSSVYQSA